MASLSRDAAVALYTARFERLAGLVAHYERLQASEPWSDRARQALALLRKLRDHTRFALYELQPVVV